jgi:hypothetical protein
LVLCTDTQKAVYNSSATCTDSIKNGTETGIDCGGSCPACVSCPDFIGGCNGTTKYCVGTPEYDDAMSFFRQFPNAKEFWYFISYGADGKENYCMNYYKDSTGALTLSLSSSPSSIDPSSSSSCVSKAAWNAMNNGLSGDCSLSMNGKFMGLATKYNPGGSGICVDPVTGAYINCTVSKTDVGDGKAVTQDGGTGRTIETTGDGTVVKDSASGGTGSTGSLPCVDANKDGFDDVRGVPCSSAGSGIGTTGLASKCVDLNKDMIDDVTGMPCFQDDTGQYQIKSDGTAPEYNTSVDTPGKSSLSSLFSKAVTPIRNFITGSRLQVSGSFCSQTITLLRKPFHLDLCPYESVFSALGSVLLGASALMSVYWVFK